MGYLSDTVKKVSADTELIFVGTGVIVTDNKDRVFMGRRSDNNTWCIPGGSLELNEKLEECAARELMEETGIIVKPENLILNTVKVVPELVNKNGRYIRIVSVSYIATDFNTDEFSVDAREFSIYSYFTKDELIKMWDSIAPYTQEAFKVYYNLDI